MAAPLDHAPAWFAHSMTAVEPYAKVGKALISSGVHKRTVLERSIGQGQHENVSELSEISTGTTVTSYKPSFGEPRREHRRTGYHRDPDYMSPRMGNRQKEVSTNNQKKHGVANVPDAPDYGPGSSGMFTNGFKSRSVTYPRTYYQGKDNMWERKEDLPKVFKDEIQTRETFQAAIRKDAKIKERRKERERAENSKSYGPDPFDNTKPTKRDHKRVTLSTQLKRHEEGISGDTDMAKWAGKQGSGAPRRKTDGSVITQLAPADQETHMSNTQNHSSTRHFDPEYRTSMRRYRETLDAQLGEIKALKEHERARSAERITLDDGGVSNFGKTQTKRRASEGRRNPPDHQLANDLKAQRKAERAMRKKEKTDAVFSDEAYNPWGKHDRNKNATHVRRKDTAQSGQRVQGASLDSTKAFGTRGGGAPSVDASSSARKVLDGSRSIEAVEARVEAEARARGESVWGKAGAGAPVLDEHGKINTRVCGRAVRDVDETSDFRSDPEFRKQMKVLAKEQGNALRAEGQSRIDQKTADRLADSKFMISLKLQDDSEKHGKNMAAYTGDQRFPKPGNIKDLSPELAYTPMVPKDNDGLRSQIEEKRDRLRRDKSIQLKEEAVHNKASDFATANSQRVGERIRQRLPKKHDPILHAGKSSLDPATKKALANDLDFRIRERAAAKKQNRALRKKQELEHSKASNRMFGPQQQSKRKFDPKDFEYKMLVKKASNLM